MVTVQAGSAWARGLVITRLGGSPRASCSTHIVARLFSLPVSFFQRQMLGDLVHAFAQRIPSAALSPIRPRPWSGSSCGFSHSAVLMIVFSPHLAFDCYLAV